MPSTGTHLVDLHSLMPADIPDVIISSAGDHVLSRFRDNIWDMSPYLAVKNIRQSAIRFDLGLPDGSNLTEPQHARLLNSAKQFLYARWRVRAPHSRKLISARTLMNNWAQMRAVLKWMAGQGIRAFGELTPKHCLAYAASQKNNLKSSTRIINLQILTTYYDLRDHLTDPLTEYPWGGSAPIILVGNGHNIRTKGVRMATTEVIPSRILRILVQKALDYIEQRAVRILSARDTCLKIRSAEQENIFIKHRRRHPDGFASIYKDEATYLAVRVSHSVSRLTKNACIRHGFSSQAELKSELVRLRTACYIVIALFSGMRDSELASLEVGCFSKREGFDGEIFCWLKGLTYKLEHEPMPAQWMVPEIVGKAVDIATRLGTPGRGRCAGRIRDIEATLAETHVLNVVRDNLQAELGEARKHQYALMFAERECGRILALGGAIALTTLREFAQMAMAVVQQPDMEGIIDHDKVLVGESWPLAPHQFRRTFAVFVARNLLGDMRYLREHFKHWSIDMTLYYTRHNENVDATVFSDVLTERDELQAIILEKWVRAGTPLSGGGGKRIMAFRHRGEVKTVRDMREFCRKLGEDVYIRGTGHSWCMASGSGCGGQGLYDAVRCMSCAEGVVDETHLQVWRGIRQQQIEILQCKDLGAPSWQRCVDHLREAEKILHELGDTIIPYPTPLSPLADIATP